jgi:hypothetical protein
MNGHKVETADIFSACGNPFYMQLHLEHVLPSNLLVLIQICLQGSIDLLVLQKECENKPSLPTCHSSCAGIVEPVRAGIDAGIRLGVGKQVCVCVCRCACVHEFAYACIGVRYVCPWEGNSCF